MPPDRPNRHPLYRPELEHDACGVGLVADVAGQARRDVVTAGLSALVRLTHRGAPAELDTIDGCGVMTAIPWRVLDRQLPPAFREGRLTRALGAFFMPAGAFEEAAPIVERELRPRRRVAPRVAAGAGRAGRAGAAARPDGARNPPRAPRLRRAGRRRRAGAPRCPPRHRTSARRGRRRTGDGRLAVDRRRWSTRDWSSLPRCRASTPIWPIRNSSRRSSSFTSGSARTRPPTGRSRSRFASPPTTARSTRSPATAAGFGRAPPTPARSPASAGAPRSAPPAATRSRSTRRST